MGSEGMNVQALADKLACNSGDVLKALFMKGIMAQVNQVRPMLVPDIRRGCCYNFNTCEERQYTRSTML